MRQHHRGTFLVAVCAVSVVGAGWAAAPETQAVAAGERWQVSATAALSALTIGERASIAAPAGYDVTLTVNGVNVPVAPGTYKGKVVVSVTRNHLVPYGRFEPYRFRSGILINDGKHQAEQSVSAMVVGGKVSDAAASNIKITSQEERVNGIVVTGNSAYTINNARIDLTGNGGNDFAGYGVAIMSAGNAKLTVNNARIRTLGAIRAALFIGGKSTMTVNNSFIETFSGTLPAGYEFNFEPGRMMEVPYGMGLSGNVRSTNLIDEATVYYNNVHLRAHGWGALSSDGNGPTRMFVKDSRIETIGSGYGAYANGDCIDTFSNTRFDVVDVALIMGGNGSGVFTDGSVVNSDKSGMFMHQGSGGSKLTIEKKSVINTKQTLLQIKGRGGDLIIDDATVNPGNGIILQSMENDDPIMVAMASGRRGGGPPGAGPPGGGPPGGGPPGGGVPGSESAGFSPNVNATFRNATLKGNVYHGMSMQSDMSVSLQKASLTGAISTSSVSPLSGVAPNKETYRTVGEVKNTVGHSARGNALKISVDGSSLWLIDKTSYMTGLAIAEGGRVAAPAGRTLGMTVNGVATPIRAGIYTGKIVLQVGT